MKAGNSGGVAIADNLVGAVVEKPKLGLQGWDAEGLHLSSHSFLMVKFLHSPCSSLTSPHKKKEDGLERWPVVKSTCCSRREPGFDSQHSYQVTHNYM